MRTLLSLALLALALPASAQATFGVKLGINAATVSFEDEDGLEVDEEGFSIDKQSRLGFVGGLTADIPISPTFSFRPEILYSQKGYAAEFDIDGGIDVQGQQRINGTVTAKIDYLEVPLMLAYRIPTNSTLEVAVEVGPSLAYTLSTGTGCSGDLDGGAINSEVVDVSCNEDEGDFEGVRDFDLGGALGVTIGSGPFGVGLRYTNSILSITEGTEGFDDNDARNQVFTVTGHYRFGGQ